MFIMPDLEAWGVFARLAQTASFTQTAEDLGVAKATVSKAISRLEMRLGTTLLNRTTRQVSLTDIGRVAAEKVARLLAEAEFIEAEAMGRSVTPRGTVRMAAPASFAIAHVSPELPALLALYPEVTLDLHFSDEKVDVVAGGYDLVLRIMPVSDAHDLRARPVCGIRRLLVGSPDYFERRGRPTHPKELAAHLCMDHTSLSAPGRWRFQHGSGEEIFVEPAGPLRANSGEAFRAALLAGLGIAVLPEYLVWEDILAGRLDTVMTDWSLPPLALYIVSSTATYRPASVTAVIEFLVRRLARARWATPGAA